MYLYAYVLIIFRLIYKKITLVAVAKRTRGTEMEKKLA